MSMKYISKIKSWICKHKIQATVYSLLMLAIIIFAMTYAFAATTPVKSVVITSENTSYENNEPGSWQVTKSAEWIGKGKAQVKFNVDTNPLVAESYKDVIMVLDVSLSMQGDKINKVKEDSKELVESVLSNENNRVALITFDSTSQIISNLTDDKEFLINKINDLSASGNTNYYQALVNVDTILKDYQQKKDTGVVVMFLTDGYPCVDTPNQIAQYKYLKSKYQYITINGIQYEMGDKVLNAIVRISDYQYIADIDNLHNVLFDASLIPISYDNFQIVDYIDNNYYNIESIDDITVNQGTVKLEEENGTQKITWTIPSLLSGRSLELKMTLNLKNQFAGQGGVYPTNEKEEIISEIGNIKENVTSTKTPALLEGYHVVYDSNAPEGCTPTNVPTDKLYSVYDTVSFPEEEPSCNGYEFNSWEIVTDGVTIVNDDYFIMPESDVTIRAKWSKIELSKSMEGTVQPAGPPIMKTYVMNSTEDYHNKTYKSKITSIVTKDNIDIPSTAIESWDVSAAGDRSVIAYIEDDGSGAGTYKVTIGGIGGIIANEDSSNLFYGDWNNRFSKLTTIDLSYLDTSNVKIMDNMFNYCNALVELDLTNFSTVRVTSMNGMFANCTSLKTLDLSSFYTPNLQVVSGMFFNTNNLELLNMRNMTFDSITAYVNMFMYQNAYGTIIVKNSTAKAFIEARLEDNGSSNASVVIWGGM